MNRICFMPMWPCSLMLIVVLALAQWPSAVGAEEQTGRVDSTIWEEAIQKFEALDRHSPSPQDGILFIGGSNIRRWKLEDNFSDRPVINRGFGGSMIADAVHFADRIVLPYRPRMIILYGGANDMGRGRKTPRQVLEDYQAFVMTVHDALPKTRIVYISLPYFYRERDNPEAIAKVTLVNQLIREAIEKDKRLVFVDVNEAMTDENGQPRGELFQMDGVHMNAAGYKLWASQLRPIFVDSVTCLEADQSRAFMSVARPTIGLQGPSDPRTRRCKRSTSFGGIKPS